MNNENIEALHRIKFYWKKIDTSLEIEVTNGSEGEEINIPLEVVAEATRSRKVYESIIPAIGHLLDKEGGLHPVFLRENTEYRCILSLPAYRVDAEVTSGQFFSDITMNSVFKVDPQRYWRESRKDNTRYVSITGRINFKNHVGVVNLAPKGQSTFLIEVAASKMSFFDDFPRLLNDINEEVADLMLSVTGVAGSLLSESKKDPSEYQILFIMRLLFKRDALPAAMESIIRQFHSQMVQEAQLLPLAKVKKPNSQKNFALMSSIPYEKGGPLASSFGGYTPQKLYESEKSESTDTLENRFVKNFITELLCVCQLLYKDMIKRRLTNHPDSRLKIVIQEINVWMAQLEEWLSFSAWSNVGEMTYIPTYSQVLQGRAGYREILRYKALMGAGFRLIWDFELEDCLLGKIRPVYELYEYWCFFQLMSVLRELAGKPNVFSEELIHLRKDSLSLNLKKGLQSRVDFDISVNGDISKIRLWYNRSFELNKNKDSYSLRMVPDFTVEIQAESNEKVKSSIFIHFDAKYRIDRINVSTMVESSTKSKNEDLIKMHAYNDAIKNTFGSFILYPGQTKVNFKKESQGVSAGGIGAFPMRIHCVDEDKERLKKYILEIIQSMSEGKVGSNART